MSDPLMHWVVGSNVYSEENYENLLSTIDRLGFPHSIHKVIPFIGQLDPEPTLQKGARAIVMGSYSLARVAKQQEWLPGAFLDNLDFEIQYKHWGNHMLNHDAHICRFADVPEQPVPFFMRPVHDTKAFSGLVTDYPSYLEWRANLERMPETVDPVNDPLGVNLMTLDTPVMVCKKKEIYSETRCWVIDRKVVTASLCKVGTLVRYEEVRGTGWDNDLIKYAENRASDWSPNRAYVMDVAESPRGREIIEINCLNCAGWYRCDVNKLVMALASMQFPTR